MNTKGALDPIIQLVEYVHCCHLVKISLLFGKEDDDDD